MSFAPSGEQFEISAAGQRAVLVEVGGGVREYTAGDRPVLDGYPIEEMCSGGRGTPLISWPNRLRDGSYSFGGATYQTELTEPGAHNAIHGLLRWRNWTALERAADRVVLGIRLHPSPGYPFPLDVRIEYTLGAAGLVVATTVTNLGDRPCPYGFGQHPYLSAGGGPVDDATLSLDAGTWIRTDERGLPTGREQVAGSAFDFASPRTIGTTVLDHAFTDLARDPDGLAWVRLTAADGRRTGLWLDEHHGYVQLFSGDTLGEGRRRRGLAVEPMTCPANAFRSGEGLLVLEPGRPFTSRWGIRPE